MNAISHNKLIWGTLSKKLLESYTPERAHKIMVENEIHIKKHRYKGYSNISSVPLTNISFLSTEEVCKVTFSYDSQGNGMYPRRGSNVDFDDGASTFYHQNMRNETVFRTENGQYIRIIYNERLSDVDTGE